ncbi:ribonuclease Z [Gorillibacterium sp. sgz5001074]|uniref:ribonuclease Z n=1 Tax=Gorillibacterium sp. sgz5001074 TaxID=3446695 RepID=UPI003F67AD7D
MELYFLGTGAGMPSRRRNVTSIALNLLDEIGSTWLFDCGEGTQQQILQSPVKLSRTDKIFITHLHGDHLYGMPGLLTSRSYQGGDSPLTVYGPPGIREFIDTALRLSQARLSYELETVEITEEGLLFEEEGFQVSVKRLEHRIECFGFRIAEKVKEGKLDADKLKSLGVPSGPMYGMLKAGKPVTLPDGSVVRSEDVVGPSIPGRIVTILGDTLKSNAALELALDADLLVHEATFDAYRAEMAAQFHHSTTVEAAETARDAGAIALVLTHISSRYGEEDAEMLLAEARAVFPNAHMAEDFWSIRVPYREGFQPK